MTKEEKNEIENKKKKKKGKRKYLNIYVNWELHSIDICVLVYLPSVQIISY